MGVPDLLEGVAGFVAEETFSEASWRERARVLLADAIVLACATGTVPGGSNAIEIGAGSGAHLSWFTGNRLGAADAVQANAAAVCARFQEDTDMSSWAHPGSFVVPAAVAGAVHAGGPMSTLVDALVAGYAVTSWLGGDGDVAQAVMARGLRPSPTFAPAGACAAACRALGLSADQTRHAIGGALLVARGTLHSVGSGGEDWRLHNPGAARDGLLFALAAANGLTSGGGALTAEKGFLGVYTGSAQAPAAWRTPPTADRILQVWHKALPTLGDNMAVALAARELHRRTGGARPQHVTVRMNGAFARFPGTQTRPPYDSLTAALASVRFVTAQLLLTGHLTFEDYDRRDGVAVVSLADALEIVPDEGLDHIDAEVRLVVDGVEHTCATQDLPRTLFFRDAAEQRRVAEELLGAAGADLVDALLVAQEEAPAAEVLDGALERFHALTHTTATR